MTTKYVLRDLPGVAELEDLLRRIAAEKNPEWTPLADGLDDKIDRLSRNLFGITWDDTDHPPNGFAPQIIGEDARCDAWDHEFYAPGPTWFDLADFGWDLSDGAGEELRVADYLYRQIVLAHKGHMGRLPDAPRSDAEIAKSAADWEARLKADAAKYRPNR